MIYTDKILRLGERIGKALIGNDRAFFTYTCSRAWLEIKLVCIFLRECIVYRHYYSRSKIDVVGGSINVTRFKEIEKEYRSSPQ